MERALPPTALVLTPGLIVDYDALGPENCNPDGTGRGQSLCLALPVVCLSVCLG
jgi:hypothetical protein